MSCDLDVAVSWYLLLATMVLNLLESQCHGMCASTTTFLFSQDIHYPQPQGNYWFMHVIQRNFVCHKLDIKYDMNLKICDTHA